MHKFLTHKRGDHVGVATSDIAPGGTATGIYMDDDSSVDVTPNQAVPLGHKIAVTAVNPGAAVIEYGVQIGTSPNGFEPGDYVHTHNLKTARW